MMEIPNVGALNDLISKGKLNELILVQEALQEKKVSEIAEAIKEAKDKKIYHDCRSFIIWKDNLFS